MDRDLARTDYINAWAVGRAADQIAEAVEEAEPARRLKGLAFEQWYGLRGRVDARFPDWASVSRPPWV